MTLKLVKKNPWIGSENVSVIGMFSHKIPGKKLLIYFLYKVIVEQEKAFNDSKESLWTIKNKLLLKQIY